MKRTFIAIKIPFSKNISEIYHHFKNVLEGEKIKWVEDLNFHLTIQFLGDTSSVDIEKICNKLSLILRNFNSFQIKVKGVGVFKSVYNPKAIWFGIEGSEVLNELHKLIFEAIDALGIEVQQNNFKPHLTIGRIKLFKNKKVLKDLISEYNEIEIEQIKISEVYYFESILTPKGPVYNVIQKFNLI